MSVGICEKNGSQRIENNKTVAINNLYLYFILVPSLPRRHAVPFSVWIHGRNQKVSLPVRAKPEMGLRTYGFRMRSPDHPLRRLWVSKSAVFIEILANVYYYYVHVYIYI